jgi:hypothetical protein
MATIALSAAGMALGGSIGGSVLGLSMATIGRAAGAAIGRRIDEQIMGGGSEPVEVGRIDRFRVTGAVEGADLQQIYGRMRVAGQVIWATQFLETSTTSGGGGGKGSRPRAPETTTYAYSVSLAIALCEGEIGRIGRIWADGSEISPETLNMRVYTGTMDQLADPKIAAVEGMGNTPAYRGTTYVVLEDLDLDRFGNRIPQLTFEVIRPAPDATDDLPRLIKGAALIPGTGEYALATSQVHMSPEFGAQVAINTNSPLGGSDFTVAMNALQGDLPACRSVMLAVAWFGDDLRCADCTILPKVTQNTTDATAMPWQVSGIARSNAAGVAQSEGAPLYQGTPADAAVVEAISDLKARGMEPVFYPELLMEQLAGNSLPDPWSGAVSQPATPWRGRVTTSLAPGVTGTPDGTTLAATEVAQFMGAATPGDFVVSGTSVSYTGPAGGGYSRYILHYAHLCAAAGGVTAFCIGSDLSGLTQVRDETGAFPFVAALRALAADVRSIVGPGCKISYAADWNEYHGYRPAGTDDKLFHLDALWADPNIDFIGINGYFPLSDWRDAEGHADAAAGAVHSLSYLQGNVAGGEGYDWSYPTPEARAAQRRVPITDSEGEPWIWRPKDLRNWWANPHHARIDGVRQANPTDWVPQSKPIWFTEMGCPAVDKGANQPHRKLSSTADPTLPDGSSGARDDLMQMQYLRAMALHFADDAHNPAAALDGGRMVDLDRMHVWGWDARPYPFWPGNRALWNDGDRYAHGAWLNGRASNRSLASVVAEICDRSGVTRYDTSALFGVVRGYMVSDIGTGRAALQPLMLAYGFDAIERDGVLVFRNRSGVAGHHLTDAMLALDPETDQALSLTRAAGAEVAGRVQMAFLHADGDYDAIATETVLPDEVTLGITRNEAPLVLTRNEGQATVARWLQEARIGRDTARFALPPSQLDVGAGDVVTLDTERHAGTYRIDRIEEAGVRLVDATRVEAAAYAAPAALDDNVMLQPYVGPIPAELLFLDLPLLTGDEQPHAPYVAAAGRPWPGSIALYGAPQDSDYTLQEIINEAAVVGVTQSALARGPVGIWDRQAAVEVTLVDGSLSSATAEALLAGANLMAIGDGSADSWEVFQFQHAEPLFTRGFGLSGLLRGQAGSRGLMPNVWPVGSRVVLLNGAPEQITIPTASRGIARHFRYGPAKQPITDPSYRYISHAFAGNGLRPYPVAHLRARATGAGLDLSWIRCSRIDGDIWADGEIPLGEDIEAYTVRVIQGNAVRREVVVNSQGWFYTNAQIAADVGGASYDIAVAQMSDRFGAGPFTTLTVTP